MNFQNVSNRAMPTRELNYFSSDNKTKKMTMIMTLRGTSAYKSNGGFPCNMHIENTIIAGGSTAICKMSEWSG